MLQINHYNGFGRQCEAGCVGFSYQETGVPGGIQSECRRQRLRFLPAGLCRQRADRYGPLHRPAVLVFRRLCSGRLARHPQAGCEPRPALRHQPAADRRLDNRWSDFSPTTPNPAAGGIPGAVLFAGNCTGCVGSRTLSGLWDKGFGPHIGFAYSKDSKTVIRGFLRALYGALVSVSGSTHNMGFTLTQTFTSSDTGILPTYTMDGGMPPWTAPPFVNPSVSNGTSVAWFQGNETTKLPAFDNINFSHPAAARQLHGGRDRLQRRAGRSPAKRVAAIITRSIRVTSPQFGTVAQSTTVLNSLVGSATANAAGVYAPFPAFNTLWGIARHGGAGVAALPAVHLHRHLCGRGRS